MPKITTKIRSEFIKERLSNSQVWVNKALLKIYEFQTVAEQEFGVTIENNKVGFNGSDSEILSSFAEQLKKRGFLTPKQEFLAKKKMKKYWRQILEISDKEKLDTMITKS